jgi:transglutaminase/protease-like cytokinesis protein 3
MCKFFISLLVLFAQANSVLGQENIYDILGMDMVDSSDYDGKIMFYEEMPFNLLNKAEVDKKIEHDIQHAKTQHFKTLGDVNAFLTKNKVTEYQKVRSFFVWITQNIEFDMHSYLTNHFPPQHPLVVYQSKKALSKGFADMLSIFCQNNDIECRSLKGYTRGFDIEKEKKEYPNHYWNVVRIDGYWYLLDMLMCVGKVEKNTFIKKSNEDYFLPPPIEFIKTHLPMHASWQLLENHVSLEEFYK